MTVPISLPLEIPDAWGELAFDAPGVVGRNRSGRLSPMPGRVGLPRSRPSAACGLPIPRPWWH